MVCVKWYAKGERQFFQKVVSSDKLLFSDYPGNQLFTYYCYIVKLIKHFIKLFAHWVVLSVAKITAVI